MADLNQDAWGKFIEGIQAAMGAAPAGSQLQVLGAPIPFDWGVATGNLMPLEFWNFCDQLPAWSEVGGYTPGGPSLSDGYGSWLNNIKQDPSQALINQITAAQQKLASDQTIASQALTVQGAAYKQYKDNQTQIGLDPLSFADWATQTGADKKMASLRAQVQKDADLITSLLAQENREYSDAWAAYSDTKALKIYTDDSGQIASKRMYEWSTNPTQMTQALRAGTLASEKTIAFSASSASHDFSKSWASAQASVDYVFWGGGGGGGWTRMNQADAASDYSASIAFKNVSIVTVDPDTGWFNSGYLRTKADGPYVDANSVGMANEATGNQTYFFGGPKAILPAQVTGLLVGYQPSFKITTRASAFSEAYKQVQASGGLRIGPFHFGGDGGHESDVKQSSSQANTIEGADTSNVPMIFGVYVRTLP